MCRIAGMVNTNHSVNLLQEQVKQMCLKLAHGGPDGAGIYTEENARVVLGHRRLSLLDLSVNGAQPMHYLNRFTITYNGELYNYKSIKTELQASGFNFTTQTDTEVILAAFAKWNVHAFVKLNGMFAFALWDNLEQQIYLVRDAAGIKPLYYSTISNGLAFASELHALTNSVTYLNEVNANASVYQLAYGFIPEPITTAKHIKPLPKGCYLKYSVKQNTSSLQSFNFFSFSNKINEVNFAKQQIANVLEHSVATQMLADVPVGIFLSGGIDSAIIAKLANKYAKNKLHTLSIYFNEEKYSEKKYQDLIADEIKSTHHSILLTESNFHAHFAQILNDMDMPSCDGINTWFISKFAADEGLKAVLSGIGADEIFGGYPSFNRIHKAIALQNLPNITLSTASKFANKKYDRIAYLQMDGIRGIYLSLRGHFSANEIAKQLGMYEQDVWNILEESPASANLVCDYKNQASWMEFNIYMQDQLLRDADVMSMKHGLELRVPFLDNEVINTGFAIEPTIKYKGSFGKDLLIQSFDGLLPEQIWNRPKMGFSFPFAEWMKNNELVKALGQNKNKSVQKSYQDFVSGKLHWSRIMSLLVLNNKMAVLN
jgi:asparagine synthase (glutamine-hydrolysing)